MKTQYTQNGEADSEPCTESACAIPDPSLKEHPRVFAARSEINIRLGRMASVIGFTSLSLSVSAELRWVKSAPNTAVESRPSALSNSESSFRVGDWLVEPQLNRIERDGNVLRLEPKAMDVLVCLSREPGRVVSKEELMGHVWRDVFVTDDVLKGCIWQLRRAFQDDCKSPKVIETIPKSGYRLLLPVQPITNDSCSH